MNRMINIALTVLGGASIVLFVYFLEFFDVSAFDFTSNSYLISYFLLSCIVMTVKTISDKNTIKASGQNILAVWRLEGDRFRELVQHEFSSKKVLVKALYGITIFLVLVSAYPLIVFNSYEVTVITSVTYLLLFMAAVMMQISTNKAIKDSDASNSCELLLTTNSLVYNGSVKYTWNDMAIDLISADVVNDGTIDGALSIRYRKYGRRLFTLRIPVPTDKRDEALTAAAILKTSARK